jgi:hypothetical protein
MNCTSQQESRNRSQNDTFLRYFQLPIFAAKGEGGVIPDMEKMSAI